PILENMGLEVIGEHPYKITSRDNVIFWKHDFFLTYHQKNTLKAIDAKERFTAAFDQVWSGTAGNDCFNRLVLAAAMDWRQVMLVRACARYLKQLRLLLSRDFITDTFLNNIPYLLLILEYFSIKFNPDLKISITQREIQLEKIEKQCMSLLEQVESLSEDLVLRRYLELCKAMLRTNYFQISSQGETKPYMSFKFRPGLIPAVPLPVPMFEIFVYSEQVEGVHLRGGKVARGGLRWSDRVEDYRTEILGLVKAQQVKNAVIVPVGAKGGFISRRASAIADRSAFIKEGISSYKVFIRGLLDITDNLQSEKVVSPKQLVRHDDDDVYLVVAADKGTATFSDISNGLAADYGFWLGDAFASGGSQGYDHKGMGITARGAWVSVQRHFRERSLNIQQEDFTVAGIGDMGGDVFGNGMLLSEHIKLLAAFNHMHIFIDPNPNPEVSFKESQRLFLAPDSGWSEYDKRLISRGGGVFLRTAKSITITAEMKKVFDIDAGRLTPNELLQAILKAPVDLIWNGGIGTYIKATSESDEDVGDRANDSVRVNGKEVRAKVVGEGGNLGVTQLGRIEFANNGGAINTDFIDNAAGVDCSDHEVNIKILLNSLVAEERLTVKQRNRIMSSMTEEVAELVLTNSYRQTQAISIAEASSVKTMGEYRRLINDYVKQGKLNRKLEFLPSEEALSKRSKKGLGLTRPELSVLMSYAKADLKERLVDTWVTSDPFMVQIIETAFPPYLHKRFGKEIYGHQLRREIIATQLANEVVNTLGITFVWRTQDFTGASMEEVIAAFVMARDIFELRQVWQAIEQLDNTAPTALQLTMLQELIRLAQHAVRWLLKLQIKKQDFDASIARYKKGIGNLEKLLPKYFPDGVPSGMQSIESELSEHTVPEKLVKRTTTLGISYFALDLVEITHAAKVTFEKAFHAFILFAEALDLGAFREQISLIDAHSQWHQMARESFLDELDAQTRSLCRCLVESKANKTSNIESAMDQWLVSNEVALRRWRSLQKELQRGGEQDLALYAVAIRELAALAQANMG
ncbi:MAG: NAD-glutamate dehydrogenase, partial [Pseudomonadales bacterium]